MNIHFINEHLETLYTQVYKFKPTVTVHGLKVPDEKMTNSPTLRARSKSVSINCKTGDSEALDSINLTNPLLKHNENLAVLPPRSKIDEELPFICSICDCSALSLESLNIHKLNNHSPDFSALCSLCDRFFKCENILQVHMSSMHYREVYYQRQQSDECNTSEKILSCESNVDTHIENTHVQDTMD